MRRVVGAEMGVKAAGGVRDLEGLKAMVAAGATRVGASAGVASCRSRRDRSRDRRPPAIDRRSDVRAGFLAGLGCSAGYGICRSLAVERLPDSLPQLPPDVPLLHGNGLDPQSQVNRPVCEGIDAEHFERFEDEWPELRVGLQVFADTVEQRGDPFDISPYGIARSMT